MFHMRSRLVAVVLTLIMVFSMLVVVPVSAAENTTVTKDEAATFLKDHGVLKGDEKGDLRLDESLKRQDGMILLARMMGQEEEALAYESDNMPFQDVPADGIYRNVIAWAYDNEYTKGYSDEVFGFNDPLTAWQVKALMVRGLGYTSAEGEEVNQLAEENNIAVGVDLADTAQCKRVDMSMMLYNTLYAETADGQGKLGEVIGVLEPATPAVAPVLSEVKSDVTTTNAATVTVTGKVTPATATVTVNGAAVTVTNGAFSSVVTLDKNATNGVNSIPVVATNDKLQDTKTVTVTYLATVTVTGVKTLNAKQMEVDFSGPVDKTSAESKSNYSISGVTLMNDPDGAVLQADGKTVVLNATAKIPQYTETTATVSKVKDSLGKEIAQATFKFTPADTSFPTFVSARALGNTAIELTFSEPVENNGALDETNYKLDDTALQGTIAGDANYAVAALNNDSTKVTLTLKSAMVPGDHKISLINASSNKLQDYAAWTAQADTKSFTLTQATSATTVASVTASSQTKVTVVFTDAVQINTTNNYDNFYWNTTGTDSDASRKADAIKKIDDKTYELSFTESSKPLSAGSVYFFVNGNINAKKVLDYYGNLVAGNSTTTANVYKTQLTIVANAAPSVKSVSAKDDKTVLVDYATDMNKNDVENTGNYIVKDKDGKTFGVSDADYVLANKEVTLTVSTMTAGTYTVEVSGVRDAVGNTMPKATFSITPNDTTAPTPGTPQLFGKVVAISFNEAMATTGDRSILNVSNYQWKETASSNWADLPAGTTVTATSDNKTVRITFPQTSTVTAADSVVTVGYLKAATSYNVADLAGNLVAPTAATVAASGATAIKLDDAANVLTVATSTTLKLKLKTGWVWGDVYQSDFQITKDNDWTTKYFSPVSVTLDTDDKSNATAVFTVADANKFTASDLAKVKVRTVPTPSSTDNFGVKLDQNQLVSPAASLNKIAASVVGAVVMDNATVRVLFDAPVKFTSDNPANLGKSIIITQGTKNYTTVGTISGTFKSVESFDGSTNSSKIAIIKLNNNLETLALDTPVTVKTVSKDLIKAVDDNDNLINDSTTGFEAATAVIASDLAVNVRTVNKIENGTTFAVKFNRNIDSKSIKSDWDGKTALTYSSNGTSVTFRTDGTMLFNGASVGTVEGMTVANQATAEASLAYDSATNTLTITLTKEPTNTVTYAGQLNYVADSNIKSVSGTAVNTAYEPIVTPNAAPTVAITYAANPAKAGAMVITATYSAEVAAGETPKIAIDQQGTTDVAATDMTIVGVNRAMWTYSYTVTTDNGGTYKDGVATVSLSAVHNAAGNLAVAPTNATFTIDTTAPTATITNALYSIANNTITLTGTNFTTIAASGDVKAQLDWTKIAIVADATGTPTNETLALTDITSATVDSATTITITLASAKATALETAGLDALTGADTLAVTAGFCKDLAGNVATTDAMVAEGLDD